MPPSKTDDFGKSLVLLLAHGSETMPEGTAFVNRQAEALRKHGVFGDVQATFLRTPPYPSDIIASSTYNDIYVVPFMVSEGHSIDVIIPDALKLDGAHTELDTCNGIKHITLCRAVGTHRSIRQHSCKIIETLKKSYGLNTDDTAALVLCHGTKRHTGSRKYAEQVLRDIMNSGLVDQAAMLFLEEAPRINEWRTCVPSRYVIALPYLMTAGRHGAYDIPENLGIEATSPAFLNCIMEGTIAGPFDIAGRMLWYTPLVGTFDSIPDIIIDRVTEMKKRMETTSDNQ